MLVFGKGSPAVGRQGVDCIRRSLLRGNGRRKGTAAITTSKPPCYFEILPPDLLWVFNLLVTAPGAADHSQPLPIVEILSSVLLVKTFQCTQPLGQ